MVTDNRQAIQKHKAWMQTAMLREELLVGELSGHKRITDHDYRFQ